MREVTATTVPRSGPLRLYVLPWLAGVLAWLVVTWTMGLIISANPGAENVTMAVTAAWIGLLLAPALSAAAAVVLLPGPAQGNRMSAIFAGVPVVLVVVVWRLLTVEPQNGQGPVLVAGLVLIIVASVVSLVLATIMRRWRGSIS